MRIEIMLLIILLIILLPQFIFIFKIVKIALDYFFKDNKKSIINNSDIEKFWLIEYVIANRHQGISSNLHNSMFYTLGKASEYGGDISEKDIIAIKYLFYVRDDYKLSLIKTYLENKKLISFSEAEKKFSHKKLSEAWFKYGGFFFVISGFVLYFVGLWKAISYYLNNYSKESIGFLKNLCIDNKNDVFGEFKNWHFLYQLPSDINDTNICDHIFNTLDVNVIITIALCVIFPILFISIYFPGISYFLRRNQRNNTIKKFMEKANSTISP